MVFAPAILRSCAPASPSSFSESTCRGRSCRKNSAAGMGRHMTAALAHPVTVERQLVREVDSERFAGFRQLRLPIDTAGECDMREPPALGQDTAAVLREAGLPQHEIDALLPEATVTPR